MIYDDDDDDDDDDVWWYMIYEDIWYIYIYVMYNDMMMIHALYTSYPHWFLHPTPRLKGQSQAPGFDGHDALARDLTGAKGAFKTMFFFGHEMVVYQGFDGEIQWRV